DSPSRAGLGYGGAALAAGLVGGALGLCTPIAEVTVNGHLLRPLRLEMDPTLQSGKLPEKEQIKTLNNKSAFFIDEAREEEPGGPRTTAAEPYQAALLEQQNKVLETKRGFYGNKKRYRSNIEPTFETYIGNLKRQLHVPGSDRAKLETELSTTQAIMEDYNKKVSLKEINAPKPGLEPISSSFWDADCAYVNKAEVESLTQEINRRRSLYKADITWLQASISRTSVSVPMDNSRSLDVDDIIADVKAQYDDIAKGSQAGAESRYYSKELRETTGRHDDSLHNTKNEIVELNGVIQSLTGERENAEAQ
ncbi:K2CO protein, partial [Himantopus himantopus]|nr:K2CO protein [Himantopus himantopus]